MPPKRISEEFPVDPQRLQARRAIADAPLVEGRYAAIIPPPGQGGPRVPSGGQTYHFDPPPPLDPSRFSYRPNLQQGEARPVDDRSRREEGARGSIGRRVASRGDAQGRASRAGGIQGETGRGRNDGQDFGQPSSANRAISRRQPYQQRNCSASPTRSPLFGDGRPTGNRPAQQRARAEAEQERLRVNLPRSQQQQRLQPTPNRGQRPVARNDVPEDVGESDPPRLPDVRSYRLVQLLHDSREPTRTLSPHGAHNGFRVIDVSTGQDIDDLQIAHALERHIEGINIDGRELDVMHREDIDEIYIWRSWLRNNTPLRIAPVEGTSLADMLNASAQQNRTSVINRQTQRGMGPERTADAMAHRFWPGARGRDLFVVQRQEILAMRHAVDWVERNGFSGDEESEGGSGQQEQEDDQH